jgi:hypothetical protein
MKCSFCKKKVDFRIQCGNSMMCLDCAQPTLDLLYRPTRKERVREMAIKGQNKVEDKS